MFDNIKKETIDKKLEGGYQLWHDLPFFAKFMGDGLIVIWNTDSMTETAISNVVASMSNVCIEYADSFCSELANDYSDVPPRLRCGIARGHIYSVGNGEDYVGPCVNIASRLSKFINNVAASKRGIILGKVAGKNFVTKKVKIRGIGDNELIYVYEPALDGLPSEERKIFRAP